jgi:hypothetical protein
MIQAIEKDCETSHEQEQRQMQDGREEADD